MKNQDPIAATKAFVKKTLSGAEGGHDWFHIERVFKISLRIAKEENADLLVVSLAALLHDIADPKFNNGDDTLGPKMASDFLRSIHVEQNVIDHVVQIIENISYKSNLKQEGVGARSPFTSIELQVVQDADRIDALGAIGIARAFNYGGFKNRALYDPEIQPNLAMDQETYKKSTAPTINHFYEKLLLLKDFMNTPSGKKMAEDRHQYLLGYLKRFLAEWHGEL